MKNVNYQVIDANKMVVGRVNEVAGVNEHFADASKMMLWLNRRNGFFSGVVGEAVTNRKVLLFVQCVVSMLAMIGMAEVNLFGFVLCFGWLVCAAVLFSKEGGEE